MSLLTEYKSAYRARIAAADVGDWKLEDEYRDEEEALFDAMDDAEQNQAREWSQTKGITA